MASATTDLQVSTTALLDHGQKCVAQLMGPCDVRIYLTERVQILREDLMSAGVVDPTKVTGSALQNASSIAALMLTTEAAIIELPEKNEKVPATHPSGGYDEAY